MNGGASVSDLSALCSFRVWARYNIAPFDCAFLDSKFPQFGITVLFALRSRAFASHKWEFASLLRNFASL
jgi:DNA polymerase III epsilon subunit-like protein